MTEVTPETPTKIQEEEIKVQDGFEHLIKILDITEQKVNSMKEWVAFQGLEDILQILGALYREPDGRMDKYEPYINTEGNQSFLPRHVASNLSLLSPWNREFTSNHQMSTPMVPLVNLTKEEFQSGRLIQKWVKPSWISTCPRRHHLLRPPQHDLASHLVSPIRN